MTNKLEEICDKCKGKEAAFDKDREKFVCPYIEKAKEQGSIISIIDTTKGKRFYFECMKPWKDYAQLGVGG